MSENFHVLIIVNHYAAEFLVVSQEERNALEGVLELIPQWTRRKAFILSLVFSILCVLAWTGCPNDWRDLKGMLGNEGIRVRDTWPSSSSSSSSEDAADFEQYYEYLPPPAGASRRPTTSGRAGRAGGYPSHMSPSHYASEPRGSVYSSHRSAGGTHDDGRISSTQGGRVIGDPHVGHGNSRRQEGRDATAQTRADSPGSDTSSGPNATRRQIPAWVNDIVFNSERRGRQRVVMARMDALARAGRRD